MGRGKWKRDRFANGKETNEVRIEIMKEEENGM